jgi:hypothetical protein
MESSSRAIYPFLMFVLLVLTSCTQSAKENILVGRWYQKAYSTNGIDFVERTVNFRPDRTYTEEGELHSKALVFKYKTDVIKYNIDGKWRIKLGNLYSIVKKSDFPPAGKVGDIDKNRIIQLDSNSFSFLYSYNGHTGTSVRVKE